MVKSCTKLLMSCRRDIMSALSHEYNTQRVGLPLSGWIKESTKTASWSPTPKITYNVAQEMDY